MKVYASSLSEVGLKIIRRENGDETQSGKIYYRFSYHIYSKSKCVCWAHDE